MIADPQLAALLWQLLGWVVFPLWLAAGLADYACHARTDIARTSGVHESALHLLQTVEIGIPMLAVLLLETTASVLALAVVGAIAHTVTSYRDLHYAAPRRRIPVFEQFVHAFLIVLPLAALVLLVLLHWPAWQALLHPLDAAPGSWALRWRDPPFAPATLAAVLGSALLLGVLPGLREFAATWIAQRRSCA